MIRIKDKDFWNWEDLYQKQDVETMPWFRRALDEDFAKVVKTFHLKQVRVF